LGLLHKEGLASELFDVYNEPFDAIGVCTAKNANTQRNDPHDATKNLRTQ
jgi:hypothetical protein